MKYTITALRHKLVHLSMVRLSISVAIFSLLTQVSIASSTVKSKIHWQDWSKDIFVQAQRENKFVILDLEAVWCHWCHVMDQKTYANPAVIKLLNNKYIMVRVDQDSRPDLATRYQDYGWPATIFFAADGTEIVKRAGYINPKSMTNLLHAIIDDPTPETNNQLQTSNFATTSNLSSSLKNSLQERHRNSYDTIHGSLDIAQKFIDRDSIEYALYLAATGDALELKRARQTLDAGLALLDPSWGGIYQYSTQGDWQHPHFEKIIKIQAGYLQAYARAYKLLGEQRYLDTAKSIEQYLFTFLRDPSGAYYTSQDADIVQGQHSESYFSLADKERRAIGIPHIDKNIYARENGWIIEALITLYETDHNPRYLNQAITAANWIIKNRQYKNLKLKSGFSHNEIKNKNNIPFLGDTLAMGRAFLSLYSVTSEQHWLDKAIMSAEFINQNFKHKKAGYISVAIINKNEVLKPVPRIDDNIATTRFFNLLSHYSGNKNHKQYAQHGMRYLATSSIALSRLTEAGILLADIELNQDPLHVTVVGSKFDTQSTTLLMSGLELPFWYKRVELWDKSQGLLSNNNVSYPELNRPSAFICTNSRCSLPLFNKKALRKLVNRTVLAKLKLDIKTTTQ